MPKHPKCEICGWVSSLPAFKCLECWGEHLVCRRHFDTMQDLKLVTIKNYKGAPEFTMCVDVNRLMAAALEA